MENPSAIPSPVLRLGEVGRLAHPNDNVAIATRRLEAGTAVRLDGADCRLPYTVLEGHRFAVRRVAAGDALLSWGWPFGFATAAISPGEYVANASILEALAARSVVAKLPAAPNFRDRLEAFQFDESRFVPAPAVQRAPDPGTFRGFRRSGGRGTGTRNLIVVLGTTSRTAAYARELAARLQAESVRGGLEGIVAIAHTEGGGPHEPNNATEVLRALAGFIVHPNVGAVLAVDYGVEPVNNARLQSFLSANGYAIDAVPHHFLTIGGSFEDALREGAAIVRRWIPQVAAEQRSDVPLGELRVALQCGGSDAFSGVSGNPLAGAVAHEVIRHGGSACLAETDEAFGGEAYVLERVADIGTARAFVATLARFRERLAWHGVTAESNPSGGNKLRGLYNIALKSLGAVHKKDPRTRLDRVIDYGEPMSAPGFYFMNSPGNDLEGIAGQVASGCNLFLFVTGNGSVTNFPFVPTIKITTTTRRHQLLEREMDVNAGRYLDGEPMDALAAETFALVREVAGGRRTKGEQAGHSQVSLWRDWRQTSADRVPEIEARDVPGGAPLETRALHVHPLEPFPAWELDGRTATELVGLVLPTSMCSSQIARIAAQQMTGRYRSAAPLRFVALPHTEGCGFGGRGMHQLLHRTYRGYAVHPNIVGAFFLEHGCELVPNDVMRHSLQATGLDPTRFGWASVQLDGGMANAIERIERWFANQLELRRNLPASRTALRRDVRVGIVTAGPLRPGTAAALAQVSAAILAGGGSVLLPEDDPLLQSGNFVSALLQEKSPRATLSYGEPLGTAGFHVVRTETDHWTENLTGLGACGVQVFLTFPGDLPQPGHAFLPTLRVAQSKAAAGIHPDFDATVPDDAGGAADALRRLLAESLSGSYVPAAARQNAVDFQITRGLLGVSA